MSDEAKKPEWDATNRAVAQRKLNQDVPGNLDAVLLSAKSDPSDAGAPPKPKGIIAAWQANSIEKGAALKQMEAWYGTQLDVVRHRLAEVARVKNAQTTVIAEQFLRTLDQQHLEYLTSLGLRNTEARSKALITLGDQTAGTLRELEGRDWPNALVDKTVQGVLDLHQRFFGELMEELGRSKQ